MKLKYNSPTIEINKFDIEDIITTSSPIVTDDSLVDADNDAEMGDRVIDIE